MAFFNFFKKSKKSGEAHSERFKAKQREKEAVKKNGDTEEGSDVKAVKKLYESESAADILVSPHVTEKSTTLSGGSVYVFKVKSDSTKPQIKKAVGELYHVNVTSVNTVNQKSKVRIFRRVKGHKPGYKKAIVALASGQKIEFI